ncbi:hypothetical protein Tco_0542103 [Tanacetum coccineum]
MLWIKILHDVVGTSRYRCGVLRSYTGGKELSKGIRVDRMVRIFNKVADADKHCRLGLEAFEGVSGVGCGVDGGVGLEGGWLGLAGAVWDGGKLGVGGGGGA